jgi:PilZ domain-containing protein
MKGEFWILEEVSEKEMFLSEIKTLGKGGLMLVSSIPLRVDTRLKVRLLDGNHGITFLSKVVWTNPVEKKDTLGFNVGLQFDPPQQVSLLEIDFLLQSEQKKSETHSKSNNTP